MKNIQKWPCPTSCKEMSLFLKFTRILQEFYFQVLSFDKPHQHNEALKFEQSEDMEKMKAEFTAGQINGYPDFDSMEPFILTTDWSVLNLGGLLFQIQEGVEFFISCWGRKGNYEGGTTGFGEEYGAMESVTHHSISFQNQTSTSIRQRNQQQGEFKLRCWEGIKRSQGDIRFVSYEELEDNGQDLDQPK